MEIPVIDFAPLGLCSNLEEGVYHSDEVKTLSRQIVEASSTVGFVYLKNHGISESEICSVNKKSGEFFALPISVKSGYTMEDSEHGWVSMGMEKVNPERPGDLKECYTIVPCFGKIWPDMISNFKEDLLHFFHKCDMLGQKILKTLAIGLKLEDLNYFSNNHHTHDKPNRTTLRFLYYPSVENRDVKPDQVRLGEHTDYGSITLLFQDSIGGLEVQTRDNDWIPATPIEGTVLVNIGDVMQRWTADKLTSTPHRVFSIPNDQSGKSKERRSIAFFVHPDDQCMIECIDGSNKYPPVFQKDYLDMKLNETY